MRRLAFAVARERALDAFYHPFAHLPTADDLACRRCALVNAPVAVTGLFEAHLTVSDLTARSPSTATSSVSSSHSSSPTAAPRSSGSASPAIRCSGSGRLGSAPIGLSLHVAFRTSLDDVLGACDRLRSLGVTPLSFFATETDEPSVIGWMPAAAVYFRDPDGHLLEYLAMLDAPPGPTSGSCPGRSGRARDRRMRIRPACPDDLRCPGRDRACRRRMFLLLDADIFAGHDPGSVESSPRTPTAAERSSRSTPTTGRSAYLLVDLVDGAAHIEQVSVHPDHARKGLGGALIEHAASWARARDLDSLTLTTYVAVPWNGPYYERLGFRRRTTDEETPGLRAIREARARPRSRSVAPHRHATQPRLNRAGRGLSPRSEAR